MNARRAGFTLIEMLVVLFIFAAVAAAAASMVGDADEQFRHEDTRAKLTSLRRAVVGDPQGPVGFVADVGRLPGSVGELLEPGGLPAYQVDPTTGVGFGWRGPYAEAHPSLTGATPELPDGWGNAPLPGDPPEDFGWVVAVDPAAQSLTVRSRGHDGQDGDAGGSIYDRDYPTGPLVQREDVFVNLNTWSVTVTLANSGPAWSGTLRLRLLFPDGSAALASHASDSRTLTAPPGLSTWGFVFPANDRWVPWGARALEVTREQPLGSGTFVRLGSQRPQRVDLIPRGALPAGLTVAWSFP